LTPRQEAAAAIRSARTTREELQLKYPDLNRAVFQHLASHDQFAEAYVKAGLICETDRAQVIAQMRERLAREVDRGSILKEPNDKQVNTLIRRSVERVAADIGRPAIEVTPRTTANNPPTRDDMQVRG
jgi:2-oxoglutarate dehydrogenase complex dehydrogenase (E1) component-like enzyme